MRVLMVTQAVDLDDPVLGFTHTWINALARRVAQLHVVTLVAGRHRLADNVVLHAYGPPRGRGSELTAARHNRLRRFWFYNQCFARLVLGGRVGVVFVHMIPHWVIMAAPYAGIRRVPLVLWYTHRAVSWQLRLAHRLAERIVTASLESYPLWDESKVVALGHGVDTERFRPAFRQPDGLFRVLSVGRLSPVKQYEVLIEVARVLVHERGIDNLRVRIVGGPARPGDEEYSHRLRQTVAAHGLQEHVVFAGAVPFDRIASEYGGSDLFVSCQPTSIDKAVLEAMACGVPVATSNPAFDSLLTEGLLVPHGDAGALARAVEEIAGMSAEQRRAIGLALREKVEQRHGVESLMERLAAHLFPRGASCG